MNKNEYVSSKSVQDFIEWIEPRLDQTDSFKHSYKLLKNPKGKTWECNSLYSAFENYDWVFNYKHHINNQKKAGRTFAQSDKLLKNLSSELRKSIQNNDNESCRSYCLETLQWGGVFNHNSTRILNLEEELVQNLELVVEKLNPEYVNTGNDHGEIIMNAGFTKIYSLLIDDFIIYDGRVGAALGILVRKFCEQTGLLKIPKELFFAFGNSKTGMKGIQNRRNPSTRDHEFPRLDNSFKKHTDNNIRANWLLKEIMDKTQSKFNTVQKEDQLRAFEAALFMIGYDISS